MLKALESIDIMMKRLPALLYLLFSILANSAAYGEEQAARAIAPEVTQAPGQERGQVGLASWYGGKFQGRRTANGEVFDTNKLTAAHKTLPFGTIVRVTNLENEKTSLVRINDRGPFVEGRIIDLSRAAAVELEMAGKGIARVRVETLRTAALEERYSIQLASFAGSDNAHKALAKLTEAGFSGMLEPTDSGYHRLLISGLTAAELEIVRARLAGAGYSHYLLRKVTALP